MIYKPGKLYLFTDSTGRSGSNGIGLFHSNTSVKRKEWSEPVYIEERLKPNSIFMHVGERIGPAGGHERRDYLDKILYKDKVYYVWLDGMDTVEL
jgi:hypothetical protein